MVQRYHNTVQNTKIVREDSLGYP